MDTQILKEAKLSNGDTVMYSPFITRGIHRAIFANTLGKTKLSVSTKEEELGKELEMTMNDAFDMQDKKVSLMCKKVRKPDGAMIDFTEDYMGNLSIEDFNFLASEIEKVIKGEDQEIKKAVSPLLNESCEGEQVIPT